MNFLGNILWLVLGGLLIALIYYLVGLFRLAFSYSSWGPTRYGPSAKNWWTAPTSRAAYPSS